MIYPFATKKTKKTQNTLRNYLKLYTSIQAKWPFDILNYSNSFAFSGRISKKRRHACGNRL